MPTLLKKNSERRAGGCTQATSQNIFSAFLETSVKISLSLIVVTVIRNTVFTNATTTERKCQFRKVKETKQADSK